MRPSGRSLLLGLLASLALHAIALTLIRIPEGQAIAPDDAPIEVALAPPAELAPAPARAPAPAMPEQRQMVAPPDQINDRPPEHARFDSDRDNTVLKETVNPGVPHPAAPPAPAPAPRRAEPAPRARPAPRDSEEDARDATAAEPQRSRAPALEDLVRPDGRARAHATRGRARRA